MPRLPRQEPDDMQRLQIRLPADLYALIRDAAAAEMRSMNAEMVTRLRASFGATTKKRAKP